MNSTSGIVVQTPKTNPSIQTRGCGGGIGNFGGTAKF